MSDVPKKKKMLEYLLETRRQMIKLLVLVKWAKVSKEVDQCIVWIPLSRPPLTYIGCGPFPPRPAKLFQQHHNRFTARPLSIIICSVFSPRQFRF